MRTCVCVCTCVAAQFAYAWFQPCTHRLMWSNYRLLIKYLLSTYNSSIHSTLCCPEHGCQGESKENIDKFNLHNAMSLRKK